MQHATVNLNKDKSYLRVISIVVNRVSHVFALVATDRVTARWTCVLNWLTRTALFDVGARLESSAEEAWRRLVDGF